MQIGTKKLLLLLFLISGVNIKNPGPCCCLCSKAGRKNQLILTCYACDKSYHRTCLQISYAQFKTASGAPWVCLNCQEKTPACPSCSICGIQRKRYITLQCYICQNFYHRSCLQKLNQWGIDPAEPWTCRGCLNQNSGNSSVTIPPVENRTLPQLDTTKCKNGLIFAHINVRDIKSKYKKDDVRLLLEFYNLDILVITETWLTEDIPTDEFEVQDYQTIRKDRSADHAKKCGGGVLIYVKNSITIREEECPLVQPTDAVTIIIQKPFMKPITITGLYHPPNSADTQFLKYLELLLSYEKNESYILGDFNLNVDAVNSKTTTFKQLIRRYGYQQIIKSKTRTTKTSASTIDLILTNSEDKIMRSGVIQCSISDHDLTYCIRKHKTRVNKTTCDQRVVNCRSYKNTEKIKKTEELLQTAPWWILELATTIDQQYQLFCFIVHYIMDIHLPKKRMRIKSNLPKWMNERLLSMFKTTQKLKKEAIKTQTDEAWNIYKLTRNAYNREKTMAKLTFIKHETENNPSKTWQFFRKDIGRVQITRKIPFLMAENNRVSSPKEIADIFCEEFAIETEMAAESKERETKNTFNFDTDIKITDLDILDSIKSVKIKPVGADNIHSKVLKQFAEPLAQPLGVIFRRSTCNSEVPNILKKAIVTPIYKGKGQISSPSSYRPISIVPAVAKIFENLILTQLITFLEASSSLSDAQHGFRSGRSTLSANFVLASEIRMVQNNKEFAGAVFVDFKQAFDRVNHKMLIEKMTKLKITPWIVNWTKQYLSNRTISVKNDKYLSKAKTLSCSVPQGSLIGPVLFAIFINDISEVFSEKSKCVLYADDLVLLVRHKSMENVNSILQTELEKLEKWADDNHMTINVAKTKCMVFHPQRTVPTIQLNLHIYGKPVEQVKVFKYLGILIKH